MHVCTAFEGLCVFSCPFIGLCAFGCMRLLEHSHRFRLSLRLSSCMHLAALSWCHPTQLSTITRCSQPRVGVVGKRSTEVRFFFLKRFVL